MTLPEIFVQLPEDIQVALEAELEQSKVSEDATVQSIRLATELIVDRLKNVQFPSAPVSVRNLLDQVPQAVVDILF